MRSKSDSMAEADNETTYVHVTADNAIAFVAGVLKGNGVTQENASIIADCLIQADLRGVDTHVSYPVLMADSR